jgi:xylulose-5-phosphate/fructose-6-phosphate phosphoketolase
VSNKSANVTRIYLPPDANTLLSVATHCLRSQDYVNVIVSDKRRTWCISIWMRQWCIARSGIESDWASTTNGAEPDVVMVARVTFHPGSPAATAILRKHFTDLKPLRFVNVVDLYRLQPDTEHPHGLSDRDFDSLFTTDKPVIFNFHGYMARAQISRTAERTSKYPCPWLQIERQQ